jgi:MFS family permease
MGGLLIEHISWRAIFFINVPLAAVVLAVLYWRVPESRDESATRLDLPGAVLATLGLGAIVYGLIESTTLGLGDPIVLGSIAAGVLILIAFVAVEAGWARRDQPYNAMMPLIVFRSRTFSGANVLTLLLYGALGEVLFFLPFDLIRVQGYSATAAGASFIPFIVLMSILSRWSGGLVHRFGPKLPLIVGPLIVTLGLALYALPDIGGSYWTTFFPAVVVMGLGMAIAVAPLTTVVMGAVDQRHAGIASGINNAASRTAGLLSIAALNIVVLYVFSQRLDSRLTTLHIGPALKHALDAQAIKLAGAQVPPGVHGAMRAALQHAIGESFVDGFRVAVLIGAALALLSALVAAVMIEGRTQAEQVPQTGLSKGKPHLVEAQAPG